MAPYLDAIRISFIKLWPSLIDQNLNRVSGLFMAMAIVIDQRNPFPLGKRSPISHVREEKWGSMFSSIL